MRRENSWPILELIQPDSVDLLYNVGMPDSLLRTKLYIPPLRPDFVLRQRLIEQLNKSLQPGHKLTLVSAPAGFGKTTLLSEWIAETDLRRQVAWLSLDAGDKDLNRFLIHVVAALQSVHGEVGSGLMTALLSAEAVNVEVILVSLLNEISECPDDVVLILDDYHSVEAQTFDEAINFLIEYMPPQMHLVIASRIDPSLPLPRLRASGQMLELRVRDLRFTAQEAAVFLEQSMGIILTAGDVAILEKRTEGWIAGLQLAALSMQGLDRQTDITQFINRFAGSDRYIQDYLADEVLQQRPEGTREFLLQTSILGRFSAPLCDAVRGKKNSGAILNELDSANLFIMPLDNERRWYRYHHLFADLLKHRLQQGQGEAVQLLHERASAWFVAEGYIDDAVAHGQAAGDSKRVAEILEAHWQEIVHRGEMHKLQKWLDALGPQLTKGSAPLSMAYCWIYVLSGMNEKIGDHLPDVKNALAKEADLVGGPQPMRMGVMPSLVETMEATVALDQEQAREAKLHAMKAISLIPKRANQAVTQQLQGAASYRLALAYHALGEYEQALAILKEGLEMLRASGNQVGAAATTLVLAAVCREMGSRQTCVRLCADTLAFGNEHGWGRSAPMGIVSVALASIQADMGAFEEAQKNFDFGRDLATQIDSPHVRELVSSTEEKLSQGGLNAQPLPEPLSPRELEVLNMLAKGYSNREIAEELFVVLDTVKGHNRNIFGKLGAKNRTQAVNKGITLGIITHN